MFLNINEDSNMALAALNLQQSYEKFNRRSILST